MLNANQGRQHTRADMADHVSARPVGAGSCTRIEKGTDFVQGYPWGSPDTVPTLSFLARGDVEQDDISRCKL
jgi:hypothetical protein